MTLIALVGPTASGKTSASIDVAKDLEAVVISADSRSIYRDMNIGTAKPTLEERQGVYHWGFDLVDPRERYSVSEFKSAAEGIILPRQAAGQHTVMVGGTGLYVDSVVFDYSFPKDRGLFTQSQVEQMSKDELLGYYKKYNINLPGDWQNVRRLQAGLLRDFSQSQRRSTPITDSVVVGISTDREILKQRIKNRVELMFRDGVVEETSNIMSKYYLDGSDLPGNVYPIVAEYIKGSINIDEAKERMYRSDWQLARRQMTWLKRNKFIHWMPSSEVREFVQGRVGRR